ncbi:hypothetical protein GIB67_041913 [Kingdonia uniflora]|uniref:UBC core domain-containing protein n=1 Tax=Kingdonia uniflora TaxID=39325 RepID=A0A7J7N0Y8_9MAGN|nr:hypothetical protein GIB67_041913 [Kingdonia uniflora]
MSWKGTILGSTEIIFEGTEYKLSLSFPTDYPFKPPKVKFETACFQPIESAIDSCGGEISNDDVVVDQSENDKSLFSNGEDCSGGNGGGGRIKNGRVHDSEIVKYVAYQASTPTHSRVRESPLSSNAV